MLEKLQVFKCEHCGNIIEILNAGGGILVCCNHDMTLMEEKTADSSTEKHVPFIIETSDGYIVRIGESTEHPMTEEHSIKWIELVTSDKVYRQILKPGDKPEAKFDVEHSKNVFAREYCNLHGLWKSPKK